jgi:hypothetical protein
MLIDVRSEGTMKNTSFNARSAVAPATGGSKPAPSEDGFGRGLYLWLLTWAFTLFNTVRLLSYLPTMLAIHTSGSSSQHSLWTWLTWLGANATMGAWLYEKQGQRLSGAVWINFGNALMCAATATLILIYHA